MKTYEYQINNCGGETQAHTIDRAIENAMKEYRESFLPEVAPEILTIKIKAK